MKGLAEARVKVSFKLRKRMVRDLNGTLVERGGLLSADCASDNFLPLEQDVKGHGFPEALPQGERGAFRRAVPAGGQARGQEGLKRIAQKRVDPGVLVGEP